MVNPIAGLRAESQHKDEVIANRRLTEHPPQLAQLIHFDMQIYKTCFILVELTPMVVASPRNELHAVFGNRRSRGAFHTSFAVEIVNTVRTPLASKEYRSYSRRKDARLVEAASHAD